MNTKSILKLAAVWPLLAVLAAFDMTETSSIAQGTLNPPGPPGPTMKTLTEIEPRIAINETNTPGNATSLFRITQPGSYYLTGNITGATNKHGIQIAVDGVTLDLNGFVLFGVAGSLDGINMATFSENIVIRNGHIRNWGNSGISSRMDIGRIERITAAGNGGWGIDNASSGTFTTHIVSCEAFANGSQVGGAGGIRGGQMTRITDCVVYSNTGIGISVGNGSVVSGCISRVNSVDGIVSASASSVTRCTASNNTGDGIQASSDCYISRNICDANGSAAGDGAGIHITSSDNRIEGNVCNDSDRGIDVDTSGNFITHNTCSGNTTNWVVASGNVCLVISATPAGAISGNSGGTAPGSTDPNANFTY